MRACHRGFTLVEILIVMAMLAILAMIVLPKLASSSEEARDAALSTDLKTLRRQFELYKHDHNGNIGPEVNESGAFDLPNMKARLTSRTKATGELDNNGPCGPYLTEWPSNPFVAPAVAETIKSGKAVTPPRDDTSGWYFSIITRQIHVNSSEGAESVELESPPAPAEAEAGGPTP